MNRLAIVVIVGLMFLALACASCPQPSAGPAQAVIQEAYSRNVVVMLQDVGLCSGVILETGIVLTAKHCFSADGISIEGSPATVLHRSATRDLELLGVKTPPFSRLQVNTKPTPGMEVWTIGNNGTFRGLFVYGRVMQADDEVFSTILTGQGFSGSPLYDNDGRIVGLNNITRGLRQFDNPPVFGAFCSSVHPRDIEEFLKERYETGSKE